MKKIWLAAVLLRVCLPLASSPGPAKAGDLSATNAMPAAIQNLMATQGYALKSTLESVSLPAPNSQRNPSLTEGTQLLPLAIPPPKARWNPWDNTSIRHVGRIGAPLESFSLPFTQYEYELTYTFHF